MLKCEIVWSGAFAESAFRTTAIICRPDSSSSTFIDHIQISKTQTKDKSKKIIATVGLSSSWT